MTSFITLPAASDRPSHTRMALSGCAEANALVPLKERGTGEEEEEEDKHRSEQVSMSGSEWVKK